MQRPAGPPGVPDGDERRAANEDGWPPPRFSGSTAAPASWDRRRRLRRRALDWALGALAMLLLIALAAGVFWMSITRSSDEAGPRPTSAPTTPMPTPTNEPLPPDDLAEDELWLGDVQLDSGSLVAAGTPLLEVSGWGRDVVSRPSGISAGYVRLVGTVPFPVVEAEMGPDTVLEPAPANEVRVIRTVELLGRYLDLSATGTVEAVDGRLVMVPTSVDVDGGGFLSDVLTALAQTFVTIEHEIEGLPEGLVLQHVQVVDDGFRATLEGTDVSLTELP
ncbi:MAG: hypothetical protein Q4G67_02790 [Actinomycetia bacterium]|nr:hypothetical protein [Actinomycetes bacterium]